MFWSRAAQALAPRVEYWNLRFICNLVLGICDFRHKTPRQSHLSLTSAMREVSMWEYATYVGIRIKRIILHKNNML